ncbi:zonular occludens toxin domain-containing protein [Pseudoalteromonas umbrosa]|uniref:zonular occludens toxin domain-containing protein n=1 Tax=Pseudoalteromonas umbrosa TaxID=3048489 RepID=UPI0024C38CEC|nr:zonular occludens toxin domain-containing protein [Pseudoalteromonas sp. B95]MDK1285958.1 zonular occludens toxin domain-containing protein [Pseudoalteromonas sp. B95]
MAASIFHGPPGSFKSASAVWFEVLPALRKGRLVVTNVEGILPLDEIERELDEEFPATAQLWRLSSQNEVGQMLWRNWYHWMPCGALILMDEVQDIYPTETTQFKPESCNYKHVSEYREIINANWYRYHMDTLDSYIPEDSSPGDVDDLGNDLFNEHGHIIYPRTLKEAYMRHRKYNWDIVCCTPDITSVHKYIRNVCQFAYAHKYFDGLQAIPYYNRRPRVHEHNPKLDGKVPKKDESKRWIKVPIEVHRLYKSTATKSVTAARGKNLLFSPEFFFPFVTFFGCIAYFIYYFASSESVEEVSQSAEVHSEAAQTHTTNTHSYDDRSNSRTNPDFIGPITLPYGASDAFVTGSVEVVDNRSVTYDVALELKTPDFGDVSLTAFDLKMMGFKVKYYSPCKVRISNGEFTYTAYCKPIDYNKLPLPQESGSNIEGGFDLGLGFGSDKAEQGG